MLPEWLLTPPASTFFILCLAMLLTFVMSLANRLLTNREQLNAWRREVAAWTAEFKKARSSDDKKLLAKVQRQQPRIMKLQSKMLWQSMKVSIIFFVPIILLWQFLIGFFGSEPVARLPWFDGTLKMSIVWWYPLCSLTCGFLFSRIFGLGMGETE